MPLVDVVNFNADASCLRGADWLLALQGGETSALCRWLSVYVEAERKVSLGFLGGTVVEVAARNPEALALVASRADIFELIVRPFAHDIGPLRTLSGFRENLRLGRRALTDLIRECAPYYLPPEFMTNAVQIAELASSDVKAVFINGERFRDDVRARVPDRPFRVRGAGGASLCCIPTTSGLTAAYLKTIQQYDPAQWHSAARGAFAVCWRDGESAFLLDDPADRERAFVAASADTIFLRDAERAGLLHFSEHQLFKRAELFSKENFTQKILRFINDKSS